ncbi:UNVERIFIED_CONTAM: hypothetical protein Sradi_1211000 [Sesamum radiatum]|uniref:Uncharacterized protein n=1 Tax=Sesamum radiatum TaxID=300843 RepID=A0AAW2UP26_SESRA
MNVPTAPKLPRQRTFWKVNRLATRCRRDPSLYPRAPRSKRPHPPRPRPRRLRRRRRLSRRQLPRLRSPDRTDCRSPET